MGLLSVILAALAAFVVGAVWYGVFAQKWVEASGVPTGEDGRPANSKSPAPYVTSFLCLILVAGMMRHVFAMAAIDSVGKGLLTGVGVGLFFIAPWITLNYGYSIRPRILAVIDGGYAVIGCAAIGIVLTLL